MSLATVFKDRSNRNEVLLPIDPHTKLCDNDRNFAHVHHLNGARLTQRPRISYKAPTKIHLQMWAMPN